MTTSTRLASIIVVAMTTMATPFKMPPPPPPPSNGNKFVMPGDIGQIDALAQPPLPPTMNVKKNDKFVMPGVVLSSKPLPPPPTFPLDEFPQEKTNSIASENKKQQPEEFYDILYNDVITCPLKGFSAHNRAFFGSALRILAVYDRTECMTLCFHDTRCKSINVIPYEQDKFACELNEFDQTDNPYLLLKREGAVYYDRIRCDTDFEEKTTVTTPRSNLIEKFNNIKDFELATNRPFKDLKIKLNRLTMLEKIMKIFHREPTID